MLCQELAERSGPTSRRTVRLEILLRDRRASARVRVPRFKRDDERLSITQMRRHQKPWNADQEQREHDATDRNDQRSRRRHLCPAEPTRDERNVTRHTSFKLTAASFKRRHAIGWWLWAVGLQLN